MKILRPLRIGVAVLAGLGCGHATLAETYRWVDDNGVMHYSDQVPPEQAKHRRSKLSSQAREMEVIEGAKTAEQLRKEQQLKQLRTEQGRILAEQRDRDLSLLRTYRNEEEMRLALEGQLNTLDSTIKITESNRQRQRDILGGHEKRAAELERQGQPVPRSLLDLIEATRRQLVNYDEKLRNLGAERATISERFGKDLARFRAITLAQRRNTAENDSSLNLSSGGFGKLGQTDDLVISAIACAKGTVCDQAWKLARSYLLKFTGAHLSVETEKILQTAMPIEDQDVGLTVTRIAGKTEDILFLDVRCRPSTLGEELCNGPKVRDIRIGFKAYVEAGLGSSDKDGD